MKKKFNLNNLGYIFCLIFLILLFNKSTSLAQTSPQKQVLILNSYNRGFKYSDDIALGIQVTLNKSAQIPNIMIEYMDTKRYCGQDYFKQLYNLYNFKYGNKKFDVIIVVDKPAVDFLLKYSENLFPNVPVVFSGVNTLNDSILMKKGMFTGILENIVIKDIVNAALNINPNLKQVNVLVDNMNSSNIYKKLIDELKPYYKDKIIFNFIQSSTITKFVKEVENLSKDNIVLLTPIFMDNYNNNVAKSNGIDYICKKSPVPVYSAWSCYLSHGIFGGKILHQYFYGCNIAKIALRILNGENVLDIPIVKEYNSQYIFDYSQLKKFNIDTTKLPKGSKILNPPSNSYSIPKKLLIKISFVIILIELLIILILFFNIHKRKKAESMMLKHKKHIEKLNKKEFEITKLAFEDALTNIPNRRSIHKNLRLLIHEAKNKNIKFGIMFIDIDKFKFINDTLGHDIGDELLIEFSERLKASIKTNDIVARLGGDEFMIILDNITSYSEIKSCANRILESMKKPFFLNEDEFNITCSVGISIYPEHGIDIKTLIKNADTALYKAKNNGRNNFQLFDS
ncbi:ABC transporter substrate binding protein [Clostridium ganghwense]|uniref:ABC transporter substrate binding protein n=1 Tax=Clostridium ganghwense TaxID=312089 RepID=A0ABT4CKB4_9CLOT|nr:ABC transporter substrate binding protein [Clostridium ganghwense]MCY6369492.1 ABC transporter substrate binding protein [Clostridium ganghwense]